jgi:carbon storage regulator CsrA
MLVLSRRPGESIIVTTPNGETIRVKVNRVRGEVVSLAFDARIEVGIYREELAERKGIER